MSLPLPLPAPIKRLGRIVRDHSVANNLITTLVRPLIARAPSRLRESMMAHIPRVGEASAVLPDGHRLRMACAEPEALLNSLFYRDWTADEPEVLPLWRDLAKEARVIVDIGAHVGHFTLVAGLTNPSAKIFSFEPLQRVVALLRNNVDLNRLSNVDVRPYALGRTPGELPFYAAPAGVPSSSSLSRDFMEGIVDELVETVVPVSTLDREDLPRDQPVIMKIDTETTEPDVIAGGAEYIRATSPIIVVEILPDGRGGPLLERELEEIGYSYDAFLLAGDGAHARTALIGDSRWRNYLLVPKDRAAIGPMQAVSRRFGLTQ